jgi:hypothetical protein
VIEEAEADTKVPGEVEVIRTREATGPIDVIAAEAANEAPAEAVGIRTHRRGPKVVGRRRSGANSISPEAGNKVSAKNGVRNHRRGQKVVGRHYSGRDPIVVEEDLYTVYLQEAEEHGAPPNLWLRLSLLLWSASHPPGSRSLRLPAKWKHKC